MNRRLLLNLLKYVLALGLLTYVIWSNWNPHPDDPAKGRGLKYVWETHFVQGKPIHWEFLGLAFAIVLAAVVLSFYRWYILVRAVELPFTPANAVRLGAIGFFFNTFLPGSVGGDIVKAAFLARENTRRTVAVATVLIDRAIALWALVWFVVLAGLIFWCGGWLQGDAEQRSRSIILIAAGIGGVTLVLWFILGLVPPHRCERFAGRLTRLPRVGGSAAEFWRAIWMYRQRPRSVALAMLLAWVGHVGFTLTFYFCARTLLDADEVPQLAEHFLLVPIGLVVQAAPFFPGGVGIGEAGFGGLYHLFGKPSANGVLGSLVQRVLYWVLGLIGYLVYLRMRPSLQTGAEESTQLAATEA